MRAALHSLRSVRPAVLVRPPSRFVSSEGPTPLSKHIEQFVPTAVIFTLLISIASVSAYYNGELMALKQEIKGTASTLEQRISGTESMLQSEMVGILKEVDAKNTGTKDAIDAKIAGFKEAADLKVRERARARARTANALTHPPPPLSSQYKAK